MTSRAVSSLLCVGLATVGLSGVARAAAEIPESAHLSEVRAHNYEQLPPPENAVTLRWDFSSDAVFAYSLKQLSDSSNRSSSAPIDNPMQLISEGTLEIKSQGDGFAKIVLRDATTTMRVETEDGTEEFGMTSPPVVAQGMREDGSFGPDQREVDVLHRTLLSLPDRPMRVGDTASLPFEMPVNLMGSQLSAPGRLLVTFTAVVYIRGHVCAQLDSRLEIDDPQIPEEIEGTLELEASGEGRLFFDIEERRLVEATYASYTSMKTSFQMPEGFGPDTEPAQADMIDMYVTSDTLVQLSSEETW